MTDDIVNRLEALADRYKDGDREMLYGDYETICDAWKEIENLREKDENIEMPYRIIKAKEIWNQILEGDYNE